MVRPRILLDEEVIFELPAVDSFITDYYIARGNASISLLSVLQKGSTADIYWALEEVIVRPKEERKRIVVSNVFFARKDLSERIRKRIFPAEFLSFVEEENTAPFIWDPRSEKLLPLNSDRLYIEAACSIDSPQRDFDPLMKWKVQYIDIPRRKGFSTCCELESLHRHLLVVRGEEIVWAGAQVADDIAEVLLALT